MQMLCEKAQVSHNLARTAQFIDEAEGVGADLICFPEMSVTGYVDPQKQPHAVLDWNDSQLAPLFEMSTRSQITLVVGIAESNPGNKPFISQGVLRGGELLGVYRKINLAPDEVDSFSPGFQPLIVQQGEIAVGVAVCADIDQGDLFRKYAQVGVKVVLLPSAPGLDGPQETRQWETGYAWWRDKCETQLGEYAKKYGLHIAVATQAGRTVDEDFPGGGYLFDAHGHVTARTMDWSEGMLVVDVDV